MGDYRIQLVAVMNGTLQGIILPQYYAPACNQLKLVAYSRHYFGHIERLRHIVVSAMLKSLDYVFRIT